MTGEVAVVCSQESGPRGLSDRDQASCVHHSDSTICQVDGDTNIAKADNSLREDQFLATPILDFLSCLISRNIISFDDY